MLDSDDGGTPPGALDASYTAHIHRESIASAFDEDEFDDCIIHDAITHDDYFGGGGEGDEVEDGEAENDTSGGFDHENDERETSTHTQIMYDASCTPPCQHNTYYSAVSAVHIAAPSPTTPPAVPSVISPCDVVLHHQGRSRAPHVNGRRLSLPAIRRRRRRGFP